MRMLKYGEVVAFCEELAWLMHSGVGLGDGLTLLAEEEQEKSWKQCLFEMALQADRGTLLSKILEEADCFPAYVYGIVCVGEKTGRLEEALRALAEYYEYRDRMNRNVRSALLYPAILLLLMQIVMVVLLTQVLPIFQSVFASLGGELDGMAGGLLKLGLWMNRMMPVLCVIFGVGMVVVLIFAVSDSFREKVIRLCKKYGGDKGIMRKMNDAAFARAVSMGMRSGLPVEETMNLAAMVLSDVPGAGQRCLNCKIALQNGRPMVEALKTAEVFPAAACRLFSIGMQSGNGDVVMQEIAIRLSQEAEEALAAKVSKVEPTLVLITSILVGVILLSVMLPLMNIMEAIG